jgi:TetR/AcrR family transcriptional repressor of mexJK operon
LHRETRIMRMHTIPKGSTVNDQSAATRSNSKSRPGVRRGPGRPTLSDEELLDKALDLFLEHGFERTTIDAITASAGMAKRTVYLRYNDKAALFKAALRRAIEEWIVPIEQLRAVETEDLESTLLAIGQMLVSNIMSAAGLRLMRITNAESARMPEIGVYTYQNGTGRTIAYLADLIRRRVDLPYGLEDPEEAAVAFLYLVVSGPPTMTAWGMTLDQSAIDRHTRYCVHLFLHGLMPRAADSIAAASHAQAAAAADSESDTNASLPPAARVRALETENRRLRKLLLESMLRVAALTERREK